LFESGEHFVIILELKITPHMNCVATLFVICQCLKSNSWKQDEFCRNTI